jgi:SAM-dependent methyltransferase
MGDHGEDPPLLTFKDHEWRGWEARAKEYDAYIGLVTRDAADPLLDAAGVGAGTRLLDIACGTGAVAAAALKRGAQPTGVDFAPAMIAEATRRVPEAVFRIGDAEALDFPDGAFAAAVCAFGILHLPDVDRALAEAQRVLAPGGRYAFTTWAGPPQHDLFALAAEAISAHGRMDAPLPPSPPMFRFDDADEARRTLAAAGFADIEIDVAPLVWRAPSPQAILDMIMNGTVRASMVLQHQTEEALARIRKAILEGAQRFEKGGAYVMSWPAVIVAARKP